MSDTIDAMLGLEDPTLIFAAIKQSLGDTEMATKALLCIVAVSAAISLKRQADALERIAARADAIADVLGHPSAVREA